MPEDDKVECSELEMEKFTYDEVLTKLSELEKRYKSHSHPQVDMKIEKLEKKIFHDYGGDLNKIEDAAIIQIRLVKKVLKLEKILFLDKEIAEEECAETIIECIISQCDSNKDSIEKLEKVIILDSETREVLQEFIKYKNEWIKDVFVHDIEKYLLTKAQKWHLVAQHIHNKKLLEKLDKKEYIGSLNDPQCFEATNLGVLKRERKKDGETLVEGERGITSMTPNNTDSKPSKPIINCKICGNNWEFLKYKRCPYCFPEKEPTEDKSIKVDLGIPESVICSKCGKIIAVMEYMARKNNYKNQMCLKCTKDKELSKKGCFNCKYFIDYDLCNERDMESYEEFMYSTFLTAICNNWKEKEPTEYQQTENVVMHDGIVCKSCSEWFFGEKCIDDKISVEKVDLEDFIIMIKLKLEEMKTFAINKEFVPIANIINKLIRITKEKQKKYLG